MVWFDFPFGLVCDGKLVDWAACTITWVGVGFGLVSRPLSG